MGTFSASLRTVGDVTSLPATIEISEGRLTIAAGSTEIGTWSLNEVSLEEIPTGYRMVAEGDQILIELKDVTAFSAALATGAKKKRGRAREADATKQTPVLKKILISERPAAHSPKKATRQPTPEAGSAQGNDTVARAKRDKSKRGGFSLLEKIDDLLIRAKKRFGAYLPDFMFSRAMFVIALTVITLVAVLPAVFSLIFLVIGALIVMFGAVVYTDSVLASRFLPGRSTPQQALILGVSVLLIGVLLGAIARLITN